MFKHLFYFIFFLLPFHSIGQTGGAGKEVVIGRASGVVYTHSMELDAEMTPFAIYKNDRFYPICYTDTVNTSPFRTNRYWLKKFPKWDFYYKGAAFSRPPLCMIDTANDDPPADFWWNVTPDMIKTFLKEREYADGPEDIDRDRFSFLVLSDTTIGQPSRGQLIKIDALPAGAENKLYKAINEEFHKKINEDRSGGFYPEFYKTDLDNDGQPEYLAELNLDDSLRYHSLEVLFHYQGGKISDLQYVPQPNQRQDSADTYWSLLDALDIEGDGHRELFASVYYPIDENCDIFGILVYRYKNQKLYLECMGDIRARYSTVKDLVMPEEDRNLVPPPPPPVINK